MRHWHSSAGSSVPLGLLSILLSVLDKCLFWCLGSRVHVLPFPPHALLAWPGLVAGNQLQDEEKLNPEPKAGGQRGAGAVVQEQGGKCSHRVFTYFFQREVSQGLNAMGSSVGRDRGNKAHKGQLAITSY